MNRNKQQSDLENDLKRIESHIHKKDIRNLRKIGKYLGFLNHDTRKKAYQLIMGIDMAKKQSIVNINLTMPKYRKMEEVINHDISRSFHHLSISKSLSNLDRSKKRNEFREFLFAIMGAHPDIQYYQGMNDIAELMFMYYGKSVGYVFLEYFLLNHLDCFIANEFDISLTIQTNCVRDILHIASPKIYKNLDTNEKIGFMWPWLQTYFIHSLSSVELINRILDFLLCSPKYDISFICAAVVIELWEKYKLKSTVSFDTLTEVFYHRHQDNQNWDSIMQKAINQSDDERYNGIQDYKNIEKQIQVMVEKKDEEEKENQKNSPYSNINAKNEGFFENFGGFWTEPNSRINDNQSSESQINKTYDYSKKSVDDNNVKEDVNVKQQESKIKQFFSDLFGFGCGTGGNRKQVHIDKEKGDGKKDKLQRDDQTLDTMKEHAKISPSK